MKIFLSVHEARVDDKKRVSVPVQFREIIEFKGENIVYAYPSLMSDCIEVCTAERIKELQEHIENFELFSEERDILSASILGACEPLQIDAKGRVSMTDRLANFANIKKEAVFVGKGKIFEIWDQSKFKEYFAAARDSAKANNLFSNRLKREI